MTRMITAEIEPIGRFLFRDARPFQAGDGHVARTATFPPPPNAFCPSVIRAFSSSGYGKTVSCAGPFVAHDTNGPLYTIPLDLQAQEFDEARHQRAWLRPQQTSQHAAASYQESYALLAADGDVKTPTGVFLHQSEMASYLLNEPGLLQSVSVSDIYDTEMRTGNELNGRNAKTGRLYSEQVLHLKAGFTFRVGIRFEPRDPDPLKESAHLVRMGGESRLANCIFQNASWDEEFGVNDLKETIQKKILDVDEGEPLRLKLILLTPAIVSANMDLLHKNVNWKTEAWLPPWLSTRMAGKGPLSATVASAICGKPFPMGMWDGLRRGSKKSDGSQKSAAGPRPLYRMLPAGAVFFLKVDAAPKDREDVIKEWFELFWFGSILRRRNLQPTYFGRMGLGTAVIGEWNYE